MLTADQKKLLDAAPWAGIVLSPNAHAFTVLWINAAGRQLFGKAADYAPGSSIEDLLSNANDGTFPGGLPQLQQKLARVLECKAAERAQLQLFNKPITGQVYAAGEFDAMIYAICDDSGEVDYLVLNFRLETRSQIRSNILESITDAFFAIDNNWMVTYWNKEAERILHMPRQQIVGNILWDIYPLPEHRHFFEYYTKARDENVVVHFEVFYAPVNTWLEVAVFPSEEGLSVYLKDINARKQIEEHLNQAKKQYQDLFDFSPLPQIVYDLKNYSIKDVNQAGIIHYGYTKEELLSMKVGDLSPPEVYEQFSRFLEMHVEKGDFPRLETQHIKKSGEIIDVSIEGNSIIFEGKPARLVLAVDVTDKLRAQRALMASEKKFKALVQDGSDLLAILDDEGKFIYVNQTTTRLLEYTAEDFLGKLSFDFVYEDDRDRVQSEFEALDNKKTHKITPFRFKNGKGEYVWLETIITNMTDDPAVGGVVCNSRDVSKRIEIERRMQESIDRYQIVSKATSDAIWDFDVQSNTVIWNDVAKKLFGLEQTLQTPNWWIDRLHPLDAERVIQKVQHIVSGKETRYELEYRLLCADGSYRNVLDRSFLIFDDQGNLMRMIGSIQDITERVKYVHTVETQNAHLKEVAWTQSHVVRAPLTRIMGLADLISMNLAEDDENAEVVQHLGSAATELDNIIRDLVRKTEAIYKEEK